MGNEGSSLGPPGAEQEAQAPCEMPRLNAQDRRLLRLSVVEQLLIVGPPPGVDFAFSLDDCIDEASAARRPPASPPARGVDGAEVGRRRRPVHRRVEHYEVRARTAASQGACARESPVT